MANTENVELQYSNIGNNPLPPNPTSVLGNNTTTSTNTPSLTNSKLEEEEEKKPVMVDNNNNDTLFGDLPQEETFVDSNDITEIELEDTDGTATNRESLHLIYNNSSIDIWCFCFCIKSNRFSNLIEQCIYKLKLKIDLWLKNKKHFGVCRFVTISVLIWMIISIFFGFCLFMTITSISCLIKEYEWNNNIVHEMCFIKSYHINEMINNCSAYIYQINVINSTQCPLISNYKIFNISLTNCQNQSQNDIYNINNTYQCYMFSCDDNQIHFEYRTFDYWYCGYLPLIFGIVLFCLG
eukprot:227704_1